MKVLLIGGGAREHAIAMALKKNRSVELYTLMKNKNPGIYGLSKEVSFNNETDIDKIKEFAEKIRPELAIIGPEAPLGVGAADLLTEMGIPTVGPKKLPAQIETSKEFMRNLFKKYNIKGSLKYAAFNEYGENLEKFIDEMTGLGKDVVVKPAGLTGGKGVKVVGEQLKNNDDAKLYAKEVFEKSIGGGKIIVEEKLVGVEFTLHGFVDGENIVFMPAVQDHPHAYNNDEGPITGGMGSYSCSNHKLPFLPDDKLDEAKEIMKETVNAIKAEVGPYNGFLYGQFMLTKDGPKIIEYNARFGDPEAMNLLPILKTDFLDVCFGISNGNLDNINIEFENKATVCKYVVPNGYPICPVKNKEILVNSNEIEKAGAILFYASVNEENGKLVITGSRSAAVTGISERIEDAEKIAQDAIINFEGEIFFRSDIGTKKLIEKRIERMKELI
ncbi:phosphoribosylamine--glycine ligase [Methanococcus vannielii SB]|uniref:Phosphoribosylamine--glycine ligase n=1 Tax=Methanococcus vannielii (strain ATCC 35089 / DSM 1224 / JCM 13029 / OCM 148 / SB) TaxID=406327 RepID=PUR2_METVS|nr:phosphoribosylamine--glycine ligase [Methanococcus vannielii]A6US04.1 RecName: Full=Phosphoribosylamine--glycine ligase; AltName: Full=GARS; AltName: Full=Glycinamide ribonucleotide synthetase; AltName: Full=Phosphoribosylglycinamide synthetase [Methanococcus vannielii SB]ABR55276.1 phosphoribosylamine--glycine ligase [Methanococcus vannielii SB]